MSRKEKGSSEGPMPVKSARMIGDITPKGIGDRNVKAQTVKILLDKDSVYIVNSLLCLEHVSLNQL